MSDHSDHKHKPFSAPLFIIIIISSVSLYLATLALVAPSVWEMQFKASFRSHFLTFLVCHFAYMILEYFFHRYVLHSPLIPGLYRFYESHALIHHKLTDVVRRRVGIINYYPILTEEQHEASFFPWYSYLVFVLILTPLFILTYWLENTIPIFLTGALALVWSLLLYEILHAFEHKPLDWWLPKLEHRNPMMRKFWRIAYGFHLRHHVDPKCNEGISGFFGIPIADFLFGTWVNPSILYTHGSYADIKEFQPPRPIAFIRWLDEFAQRRVQKRRERELKKQQEKENLMK